MSFDENDPLVYRIILRAAQYEGILYKLLLKSSV